MSFWTETDSALNDLVNDPQEKPAPSFFPTNKELGIIATEDAGSVPPMPSYGGKE